MNALRFAALVLITLCLTASSAAAVIDPLEVPEPGSLTLLVSALGAASFALRRRRR